jgi:hypothetical protein
LASADGTAVAALDHACGGVALDLLIDVEERRMRRRNGQCGVSVNDRLAVDDGDGLERLHRGQPQFQPVLDGDHHRFGTVESLGCEAAVYDGLAKAGHLVEGAQLHSMLVELDLDRMGLLESQLTIFCCHCISSLHCVLTRLRGMLRGRVLFCGLVHA